VNCLPHRARVGGKIGADQIVPIPTAGIQCGDAVVGVTATFAIVASAVPDIDRAARWLPDDVGCNGITVKPSSVAATLSGHVNA